MTTTIKNTVKKSSWGDTFNAFKLIFIGEYDLQTPGYKSLKEEVKKAELISPKQALRSDFCIIIRDMKVAKAKIEEELEHSDG